MKKLIIKLIEKELGIAADNLYRAEASFNAMTADELYSPWGMSDETPIEILKGYKERVHELETAIKYMEAL